MVIRGFYKIRTQQSQCAAVSYDSAHQGSTANEMKLPDSSHSRELRRFVLLTFTISWGVGLLFLLLRAYLEPKFGAFGPHNPFFYVAACAPTLAALILTFAANGVPGVRAILGTLVRIRLGWLGVAFLLLPAVGLTLILLARVGTWIWPVRAHTILIELPIVLFLTPQLFTNTGALGEELGWRGYALPRLLEVRSAAAAAIILGAIWTIWHVPAFFLSGVMTQSLGGFGWWALDTFALSIVMAWLYLHSNGSVLIAGILPHFVINGMAAVGAWQSRPLEAIALAFVAAAILKFDAELWLRPNVRVAGSGELLTDQSGKAIK